MIGIDPNRFFLYEGHGHYGHPVWPCPQIARAKVILCEADWQSTAVGNDLFTLIFREDTFDALTRIRRGRLYLPLKGGAQPQSWRVPQHPAYYESGKHTDSSGLFVKDLFTYSPYQQSGELQRQGSSAALLIGESQGATAWSIIAVERSFNGEDLVTLRSRSNFGRLPEIDRENVPNEWRNDVTDSISALSDRAFRESPVSVVDRCGNAAQAVLSRWIAMTFGDQSCLGKDLGDVANYLETRGRPLVVLVSAVKILARMHARGKPNEQIQRKVRIVNEADAETCLALVSTILLEIKWGRA